MKHCASNFFSLKSCLWRPVLWHTSVSGSNHCMEPGRNNTTFEAREHLYTSGSDSKCLGSVALVTKSLPAQCWERGFSDQWMQITIIQLTTHFLDYCSKSVSWFIQWHACALWGGTQERPILKENIKRKTAKSNSLADTYEYISQLIYFHFQIIRLSASINERQIRQGKGST